MCISSHHSTVVVRSLLNARPCDGDMAGADISAMLDLTQCVHGGRERRNQRTTNFCDTARGQVPHKHIVCVCAGVGGGMPAGSFVGRPAGRPFEPRPEVTSR